MKLKKQKIINPKINQLFGFCSGLQEDGSFVEENIEIYINKQFKN